MTPEERVDALLKRGFTPGQAAFLAQVLVHSGYFLRRQHWEFLNVPKGGRTAEFVERLLREKLATRDVYWRETQVFHVSAPSLYALIGERNSRLRRPVEPSVVTQRLMTLDVVIAHRHDRFLATEAEKVSFFTEKRDVPLADLPARVYDPARSGAGSTTRYFVDRTPIQLSADSETITFVYVAGWAQTTAFAAFLEAYERLFRRLGACRIRFCSPAAGLQHEARSFCRRFVEGQAVTVSPVQRRDALRHFRARERFERQAFHTFSQAELDQLRWDLARFSAPLWQAWYTSWKVDGDHAEQPTVGSRPGLSIEFVEEPLLHTYPVFGQLYVHA